MRVGNDCKKEWHSERLRDDGKRRLTRIGEKEKENVKAFYLRNVSVHR